VQTDELDGESGKPRNIALGVPELYDKVLALDISQFAQTLDHGFGEGRGAGIDRGQNTELDYPSWSLRFGGERCDERRGEEAAGEDLKESPAVQCRIILQLAAWV